VGRGKSGGEKISIRAKGGSRKIKEGTNRDRVKEIISQIWQNQKVTKGGL